ncbi:MAG: hypothetical protein SWO11_16985 [Thermodesulfobacteriota bacterium]|nr:hypothetical protein [Thermodesulfobacteriota bacterium]
MTQSAIAKRFGIAHQLVSKIIAKNRYNEKTELDVAEIWEKEFARIAKGKALELVREVDPKDHPKTKLVLDASILVDKSRLIDGQTTENIGVAIESSERRKELKNIAREIARKRINSDGD